MRHDPMCVSERANAINALPCYCGLIARVRADERKAARDAVTAVPCNDTSHNAPNLDCPIWRNDALAAIDALRTRGKEGESGGS